MKFPSKVALFWTGLIGVAGAIFVGTLRVKPGSKKRKSA